MNMTALMAFALALFVAAGSPGPSIAALVARVLTNGLREVLPFLAAMWIGEAISRVTFLSWAEMASTMLMVLATIDLGWALVASRARRFLKNPRAVRIANRTSATLMVGAAAAIAAR
jgi:threonine/homoserine/homoserine lactone efflux protein